MVVPDQLISEERNLNPKADPMVATEEEVAILY
jgi:hypothetical protein